MGVLESVGIMMLQDSASPLDILIQLIGVPVFIGLMLLIFFSTYYLTGPDRARFGMTARSTRSIKQLSTNFIIMLFGVLFFTFLLWQLYYPLPYWGDQTFLLGTIGILFGVSLGFLSFYAMYRSGR